jgi:IS5 family transposase
MKQQSFTDMELSLHKRKSRRQTFLELMEQIVPWADMKVIIEPHYPKAGNGRRPMDLDMMLRIHCAQKWYNLSDAGMESELYDSMALRHFVGLHSVRDAVPDETTILNFRRLLETNALYEMLFLDVNIKLEQHGLLVRSGTIVDATLIAAPPSTKNEKRERDPEMRQTKKGNQYYFGMKIHVGTDTKNGLVHSVVGTAANVADITMLNELLHGEEKEIYGDSAYASAEVRELTESCGQKYRIHHKRAAGIPLTKKQEKENRKLSKVRAKGEHAFGVVKHLWGQRKVHYRGLMKNTAHYLMCFTLSNLYMVRREILQIQDRYVW